MIRLLNYKYIISAIAIIMLINFINLQAKHKAEIISKKDNLALIEVINNSFVQELLNNLLKDSIKISNINISDNSSSFYLNNNVSKELSKNKLLSMDSNALDLYINIIHNNIYYNNIAKSNKELNRIAKCELMYSLNKQNEKLQIKNYNFSKLISDTINIDDILWYERSELPFTKSAIPPMKKTFFDNYMSPLIVATSSLLTIFLLFTIRSK